MAALQIPLSAPIELPDGSHVADFRAIADWELQAAYQPDTKLAPEPIRFDQFLFEKHHGYYKRPWLVGRYCFDYLVSAGLKPTHKFLDLGCGAGRVGVWLIRYLEAGNYFGIDSHLPSLVAFSAYEIPLHDLAAKQPRLMLSKDFEVGGFGVKFDAVLELSVTRPQDAARAYQTIAPHLNSGAACYHFSEANKFPPGTLDALGFRFERTDVVDCPLFAASETPFQSSDRYDMIVKK